MGIEEGIQKSIFSGNQERTAIDKVLAKDDINALRDLIKKPELTRSEILEILYLLSAAEAKLHNYSDWDRYIILKFFVWIRELVKIYERLIDYEDWLKEQEKTCRVCGLQIAPVIGGKTAPCTCDTPKPCFKLTERSIRLFKNNKLSMQHDIKFLVDLYVNIARSSMSVGGAGFLELLKNKFEIVYPQGQGLTEVQKPQGGGFLGLFKKQM